MAPLLPLLMFPYLPTLARVWLMTVTLAILLMPAAMGPGGIVVMVLIAFLLFSAGHLLYGLTPLLRKPQASVNLLERPLPISHCPKLRELVKNVAKKWKLPQPDEIRLDPDTIAHVHEEIDGRRILA